MLDTLQTYRAEVERHDRITPEEEKTADVDTLVNANLRLVWKIAKEYEGRGVDIKDLISGGNMGLIRAAQKFETARGLRFSTYAAWWIKQHLMREIERQGVVRYPNNVIRNAQKLAKHNYKRDGLKMTDSAYELAQRAFLPGLSLSDPINPGEYDAPKETTIVDDGPDQFDEIEETRRNEFVEYCLGRLDERDADIVRRYYGLDNMPTQTMKDIGEEHRISKERVRQILGVAKRKLQFLKREGAEWAS